MTPDIFEKILDEHGPLEPWQVDQFLPDEEIDDDAPWPKTVTLTGDDLFVKLAWLRDRVLTHRLTAGEAASACVPVFGDLLALIDLVDEDEMPLADGGTIEVDGPGSALRREVAAELLDEELLLVFAPDFFTRRGLGVGDIVGLRVDVDGLVHVGAVDAMAEPVELPVDPGEPTYTCLVMWRLGHQGLMDEVRPPLSEMVAAQGLQVSGLKIYPADWDFSAERFGAEREDLAREYGVRDSTVLAAAALVTLAAFPSSSLERLGVSSRQFAESLGDMVGARIVALTMRSDLASAEQIMAALRRLGPYREDAAVSARWLEALDTELRGDIHTAVEQMRRLLVEHPWYAPAVQTLSSYAQSAGDPEQAADLLAMLNGTEDWVEDLRSFLAPGLGRVGRNDRCPCGSGRKYKQCHLGRPLLAGRRRIDWITLSTSNYLHDVRADTVASLRELAELEDGSDAVFGLLEDMALMECGVLSEYRVLRGPLLPPEDRDVIDSWLATPRRMLIEILEPTPGAIRVRDVATGDVLVVAETTAAKVLKPASFWLARVAWVGDQPHFFAGLFPVGLNQRGYVLDCLDQVGLLASIRLLRLMAGNLAGPLLQTSTGDDLELCTALLKPVGDPADLEPVFERSGQAWVLIVDGVIHAQVWIEGVHLRVESMSAARMDTAVATILQILPGSEVLDIKVEKPDLRGSALTGAVKEDLAAPVPAEVHEALAAHIAAYEREWLDLDIPALDGLTPRQAASDPSRRDDLIRLIASLPETDDPTQMSPARLRAMLGL